MKKTLLLLFALSIAELRITQTNTQNFEEEGKSFQYEELNEINRVCPIGFSFINILI